MPDWRETLNLPKTKFPMKANLAQREPEMLKRWQENGLYQKMLKIGQGRPRFTLHDGPPYANGHIHMGTALNKVLKDFILKSRRMMGLNCPYVPGWDCHGLPIEHNVEKELKARRGELPVLEVRRHCRAYAERFIDIQREEFKRLGVIGDWENPYLTMTPDYEAVIAREFLAFFHQGNVYRRKKPVYWCPTCVTALAEAEVEYYPHRSPSITVRFDVVDDLLEVLPVLRGKKASVLIWTTTPWTLPANLAVAMNPEFEYVVLRVGDEYFVVAEGRALSLVTQIGTEDYEIIERFSPEALEGKHLRHPFYDRDSVIILADYVTLEAGTGCVHIAPGHGDEDYTSGLKYGLDVYCPVDERGRFRDDLPLFGGEFVFAANEKIIAHLEARGALVLQEEIEHSYPHCWRCKRPVIYRATEQWFISLDVKGLREKALEWIDRVSWIPAWGKERIRNMVASRPDWCISRQRAWGVPICVFICEKCGEPLKDETVSKRVVSLFEEAGADVWFERPVGDFLPSGIRCSHCGGESFRKETDILDVWFDSGVSWAAVLEPRPDHDYPAHLYLEGSDQHRGWFQSSLICSVGTRGQAPYQAVLTHGFVVDEAGRKMSKSLGNVIRPEEIIKRYGAEILRLWVAAEDYRDDIKIGKEILERLVEAYRKIRNTARFLLGNLYDFDPQKDLVPPEKMPEFDRLMLYRLSELIHRVRKAYEDYNFHLVYHRLHQFCVVDLSATYIDIMRDTLYCEAPEALIRRSAQTVLYQALISLTKLMAPVLSFTAEEIWSYLPGKGREESVHLSTFPEPPLADLPKGLLKKWERLFELRSEITRALERARKEAKIIRNALEAELILSASGELGSFVKENVGLLRFLAIVSSTKWVEELPDPAPDELLYRSEDLPGFALLVRHAPGKKCERCWTWSVEVGQFAEYPTLCGRCYEVVKGRWNDVVSASF
ncbi:isoleucine--tRNA ligase [Thermosulfuriphilus sp.]